MQFPTILLATVALASTFSSAATPQSETVQRDNASEDAHILLQAADWAAAFGWNLSTSMCQWSAVECDNSNTIVTALEFCNLNLSSRTLQPYETYNNMITLDEPLKLPATWSALKKLRAFRVCDGVPLSGPLPDAWSAMSYISEIQIPVSALTGCHDWHGIGWLSCTNGVGYSHTPSGSISLTGTLPASWSNMSQLQTLALAWNQLTGSLPVAWRNMSQLTHLEIGSNLLTGTLPQDYSNMPELQTLILPSNNLTGTLPDAWHRLVHLTQLMLADNQLSGSLSESWSAMANLSQLWLGDNGLTGPLPQTWNNIASNNMSNLGLYGNNLTGVFPDSWGMIQYLDVSGSVTFSKNLFESRSGDTEWWFSDMDVCPSEPISQNSECQRLIYINEASLRHCKQGTILKACVYRCIDMLDDEVCRVKHAGLILSLLWSALAALLLLSGCIYCVTKHGMSRYDPNQANRKLVSLLVILRHNWDRALKWKPWGLKLGALLGLAVFWFDKATDVKLLIEVELTEFWLILLLCLIFPYVVQGYVSVYWLTHVEPVKQFLSKSWFLKLGYAITASLFPFGILLTIALDVLLFISDLGFRIPFIDQHANLAEYQPFRDMGRALFGTLPAAIFQSYVLTIVATPHNDVGIVAIDTFVLALVAGGLQLLKVFVETLYLALRNKRGVLRTFWQSSAGTMIMKKPLERHHSELVFLPQQQPRSSTQDAVMT